MRKIPNYSLLQELTMQGMMILLIIGYIAYGFAEEWGYYSYLMIGFTGAGIIYLFRNQMTKMRAAKLIHMLTDSTDFKVVRNYLFSGLMNLLIGLFSVLHFYLFIISDKPIDDLYMEYGIGLLLGISLFIFEVQKGQLIITEQGIVTGSKIRPSLICWSAIESATYEKGIIQVIPKQKFGVRLIEVKGIRATHQLSTLLRIHNKLK